jgi:hypothetical protein
LRNAGTRPIRIAALPRKTIRSTATISHQKQELSLISIVMNRYCPADAEQTVPAPLILCIDFLTSRAYLPWPAACA